MPGQRVGLVGANGCGKSTLLRCLSGQRKIDNGRLVVGRSVEMGYLEQTAVSGSDRTVWEEARSRMTELIEAEEAIDAASQAASVGKWLVHQTRRSIEMPVACTNVALANASL